MAERKESWKEDLRVALMEEMMDVLECMWAETLDS